MPCKVLLVLAPGTGMTAADFFTHGAVDEVTRRGWPVTVAPVDPGLDAYLDGSVETFMLAAIENARQESGAARVWLAGISLGCQAILRCVRARPGMVDGAMLITPYLASTGLIAEIGRTGGLRRWAGLHGDTDDPERSLLLWLAGAILPRMVVGEAEDDRFAATARMLLELVGEPAAVRVPGKHDWASWSALWRLALDRDPFGCDAAASA